MVLFDDDAHVLCKLVELSKAEFVLASLHSEGSTNYVAGLSLVAGLIADGRRDHKELTPHLRFLTGECVIMSPTLFERSMPLVLLARLLYTRQ